MVVSKIPENPPNDICVFTPYLENWDFGISAVGDSMDAVRNAILWDPQKSPKKAPKTSKLGSWAKFPRIAQNSSGAQISTFWPKFRVSGQEAPKSAQNFY